MCADKKIIWHPIPQVLEITHFEMPSSAQVTQERIVKDYEIDFFTSGNGKMFLDDKCYNISPQYVMFRRPGQRCHSIPPYSCYALTLNFFPEMNIRNDYSRKRLGELQPDIDHPCFNILSPYMRVRTASSYQKIFSQLHDLKIQNCKNHEEKYETFLTDLFLNLLTDAVHQINNTDSHIELHPALQTLCRYLQANFRKKITLSDMAAVTNMSPNYLHRLFLKQIGSTPNDYLQKLRLEQACQLLIDTDNLIEWVSEQSGFNSVSYFTKRFKMHYDITPMEFRKNHKNNSQPHEYDDIPL